MKVPDYLDLPLLETSGERSSWGVFGPDDEMGTLNFLTSECVAHAATLVRTGRTISLDLPLGEPQPQFWAARPPLKHHVRVHRRGRDDHLDEFNLQGSTQWDSLRHVRFRMYGYYGGREEKDLDETGVLGIDRWAERGIIGRGVLVDVEGHMAASGKPVDPSQTLEISAALMGEVLEAQQVELRGGDVLLVRSGWLSWYMGLSPVERDGIVQRFQADRASFRAPGIDPRLETVAWLWDNRIAAVALDTPTFEVLPFDPTRGWAHHRLLALLGMPLGELWALDRLAGHCRETGQYAFFLSSAPLKLRNGVGSPANAYAIF